jgi:hypothetical protein
MHQRLHHRLIHHRQSRQSDLLFPHLPRRRRQLIECQSLKKLNLPHLSRDHYLMLVLRRRYQW